MEVINNINELQELLRLHWDEISDDQFRVIICKALNCGIVFYRRNNIDDELAYMNKWLEFGDTFGYGGELTSDFEINSVCDINVVDKRNLLFVN